jgi:MFS transporter, ACS family, pantothenate transporter
MGHLGLAGLILSWANELTGSDTESGLSHLLVNTELLTTIAERSFVVASCNMFAYVFQAWLPMYVYHAMHNCGILMDDHAV